MFSQKPLCSRWSTYSSIRHLSCCITQVKYLNETIVFVTNLNEAIVLVCRLRQNNSPVEANTKSNTEFELVPLSSRRYYFKYNANIYIIVPQCIFNRLYCVCCTIIIKNGKWCWGKSRTYCIWYNLSKWYNLCIFGQNAGKQCVSMSLTANLQ